MNLFRPWLGVSSPSPPVFIEDEQEEEEEGEDNSEQASSSSECDTTEDSNSACLETATPTTTTVTTGSMFDFDTCESSHTPSNGMGDKMDSQSKLMAELASMALADNSQTGSGSGASCSSYSYYYNYYYSQLLYYATLYGAEQQQQQQTGVSMPPPPPAPVSTATTNAEMCAEVGETAKRRRSQQVNASSPVPLSSSSSPSSFVDTLRGIVEHESSIKSCASVATTTSVVTSKRPKKVVKSSLANLTSFRGGASVLPTTLTAAPPTPGVATLPVETATTATAASNNALKKISSMMDIQSLLTFQNMFFNNFGNSLNGGGKKRFATSRTANASSSATCVERPKKFVCVECKSAFSNRSQLNSHIRTHTGERPFVCDYKSCQKSFTRNEELTRHRRIHSGIRPYPCRWCDKRFGRKDHLRKHERTHERRLRSTIFLNYSTGLTGLFPLATTTSSTSSIPAELVNTLLPVVTSGGSRTSNGTSAKHCESHKLH